MLNHNSLIEETIPFKFHLCQNYPNPFSETTTIKYCIAYKTRVQLKVFDKSGNMVANIVDEEKSPGTYEVKFSTCHSRESGNPEGEIFYYRLEAGNYMNVKKMEIKN